MILIAGGTEDFETKEAKILSNYFDEKGLVYEYIKQANKFEYRDIEAQIEKCDIFLALNGSELDASTWLLHCLFYAHMLAKTKGAGKPKLLSLNIENYSPIHYIESFQESKDIEIFTTINELELSAYFR